MYVRMVVFHEGKRMEKHFDDHKQAAGLSKKLRKRGVKHALVLGRVISSREYAPPDEVVEHRNDGQLWCPYCGAWRWFQVPKYKEKWAVPLVSNGIRPWTPEEQQWALNADYRTGRKVCSWCYIGEDEWYVQHANSTWGEKAKRRRRKRKVRR